MCEIELACPATNCGKVILRYWADPGSRPAADQLPFRSAGGPPLEPAVPPDISFDAAFDAQTYERIDVGGDWERWLLAAARKTLLRSKHD